MRKSLERRARAPVWPEARAGAGRRVKYSRVTERSFRVFLVPTATLSMAPTRTHGATRPELHLPHPAGLPHGVSRMMVVLLLVLALHLLGEAEPVHPSEHLPHARQPNSERMPCAPW